MKYTYFIKFLVFFNTIANCQSVKFDTIYDFYGANSNDGALAILVEPNGYMIGGLARDTFSNTLKLAVLKVDFNGNIIYQKSYGSSAHNYYLGFVGSMVKTYDGGIMLGGGINDGILALGMIMKLDANGDSLWTKFYGDSTEFNTFYQIKETRDRGFICVGARNPTGPALQDFYIVKTDSVGTVQWQKTVGNVGSVEAAGSVQQTMDGGYIIGGARVNSGSSDAYVFKLDSAGNVQWQHNYGGQYQEYEAYVALDTIDSTFIVATNLSRGFINGKENFLARFMKLDNNGNTVWDKLYGDSSEYMSPTTIVQTLDGNFIVGGQGFPTNQFGPNAGILGRIFKISPQGDSLFYRSYYHSDTKCMGFCDLNYLRDLKPTMDGGYLACGWVTDIGFQDMWVVKVDSMGCVDTLCVLPTGLGILDVGRSEVSVYPNPATNSCTVKAPLVVDAVLTIYDISGRVLIQHEFNREAVVNVEGLNYGMYVITLQNEKMMKAVKFVKEK